MSQSPHMAIDPKAGNRRRQNSSPVGRHRHRLSTVPNQPEVLHYGLKVGRWPESPWDRYLAFQRLSRAYYRRRRRRTDPSVAEDGPRMSLSWKEGIHYWQAGIV